jgi:hypothetical protein
MFIVVNIKSAEMVFGSCKWGLFKLWGELAFNSNLDNFRINHGGMGSLEFMT